MDKQQSPIWQVVYTRLCEKFTADDIHLIDDSAAHVGHVGHGGAAHFQLTVISAQFTGMSMLARHRLVYGLVLDLMPNQVHAISMECLTP